MSVELPTDDEKLVDQITEAFKSRLALLALARAARDGRSKILLANVQDATHDILVSGSWGADLSGLCGEPDDQPPMRY